MLKQMGKTILQFNAQKCCLSKPVVKILVFQGRLISLCSDNSLHLWEINNKDGSSVLEELKSFPIENKYVI